MVKRTNVYETEILEWRGEYPVIAVHWYSSRSVYWFCQQCKMWHFHWPTGDIVRKCFKGDWKEGYFIKVVD